MVQYIIKNINILAECGIFNPSMYNLLSDWYQWILISVPIIVVVLCTVDIAKAVIAQDDKEIKKAQASVLKRLIIGVIIFFIPIILNLLLGYITDVPLGDTCGIEEAN